MPAGLRKSTFKSLNAVPQDAFCGQGLFSLALSERLPNASLVCLDRSEPALNALQAQLPNALVVRGDLGIPAFLSRLQSRVDGVPSTSEDGLEVLPASLPAPKVLLADPGRNGMPKRLGK